MIISPCAKFSIFAMPYTMVYPKAIIAYTPPRLRPLIKVPIKFIRVSPKQSNTHRKMRNVALQIAIMTKFNQKVRNSKLI